MTVRTFVVSETQLATFSHQIAVSAGNRVISIAFTNDYWGGSPETDRNLYVKQMAVNALSQGSLPHSGTPAAIPGVVQFERFDQGGQGIAFNDSDPANGVDTRLLQDNTPGTEAHNFAAGEWMQFTVNVATSGTYNVSIRGAAGMSGTGVRLEVNGVNLTSSIAFPNTGSWNTYGSVTSRNFSLTAGRHVLRLVSETPWIGLDSMTFRQVSSTTPGPTPTPAPSLPKANLLMKSGFESNVSLAPAGGGWQMLSGVDNNTGFNFSNPVWGGLTGIQLLTASYVNQFQSVTGRTGAQTRALYQSMNHVNDWRAQIPLIWLPKNSVAQQTDLYQSSYIKFQPDLMNQLVPGTLNGLWGNWRAVWEIKT